MVENKGSSCELRIGSDGNRTRRCWYGKSIDQSRRLAGAGAVDVTFLYSCVDVRVASYFRPYTSCKQRMLHLTMSYPTYFRIRKEVESGERKIEDYSNGYM
jgi:hypothetical protein